MTTPHKSPGFKERAFNCPFCNAYSLMEWDQLGFISGGWRNTQFFQAACAHCQAVSIWLADPVKKGMPELGRMLNPDAATAPLAHADMPEDVRVDYDEARLIAARSPRGAASLLRLGIQKLCVHLGERGDSINDDIAALVKKGLPPEIQEALDVVRVVGNNAVHPGELDAADVSAVSNALFDLVNQIVDERIARPKKLQALFAKLPEGARDAIKKRDSGTAERSAKKR